MEHSFWHDRWEAGQIAFHQEQTNPHLEAFWDRIGAAGGSTVFVPLCGKSRDIDWLRSRGHPVSGVELSPVAVRDFFAERGIDPARTTDGPFAVCSGEGVTIRCGDFFALTPDMVAGCAAVYDRASLIALPPDMRERYAAHLTRLLPGVPMLLVTFEYDQREMHGPPFAVHEEEVRRLYEGACRIEPVLDLDVMAENPAFATRGATALRERVYLLRPR